MSDAPKHPADPANEFASDNSAIDPRDFRHALGTFATGVTIVTAMSADGRPYGVTCNSFASVSLNPPLALWCIERRASTFPAFMAAAAYSINVLRADQEAMCERFALHMPAPLQTAEYEVWETGAPILKERLAALDCRIIDRHAAGDHVILVAEVVRFDARAGAPLLYFAGQYAKGPEAE